MFEKNKINIFTVYICKYLEMINRLKKWMDYKGVIPAVLADKIGVSRATISHILSGRNKPSVDFLHKLLGNFPQINANWLITGIGSMHLNDARNQNKKNIQKVLVFYDDSSFEEINT